MSINIPEIIYQIVDFIIVPVINSMVSKEDIARRLKTEQGYFHITYIEYAEKQLGLIHDRASSMVSHLSLMLALCLFLLQSKQLITQTLGHWIVIADTL